MDTVREGEGGMHWESREREVAIRQRELSLEPRDNLEGQEAGGRETQEEGMCCTCS